jgi:hypothetical protein
LGDVVVLEAPFEIAIPGPIATLPHDPVPGTVYGVDAEDMPVGSTASGSRSVNISGAVVIRYRPILSCMIADFRTDGEHRRAAEGWSMSLWEMQGDETSTDDSGESLTFGAPGLQAFTVGVPVSVNLAPFASTTTGLPIQFAIASGAFPPGVSVSLAGMITGAPTAAGVYAPVVFAASGTVGAMQTVPFYAALPTITASGTRDEFARLLLALWRQKRSRHAARLALCQFYTGSRPRTVARTTWERRADGPWVDLEQGIWWRSGEDELETVKKRRPHGIPPRLAAHLQRWKRIHGGTYIAETARDPGQPVWDIGKALEGAAARAGVKRITPHTLKHTAITLFIQSGGSAEDASDYFSTSIETIQSNYWHHSPAHQVRAVAHMANLGRKPG